MNFCWRDAQAAALALPLVLAGGCSDPSLGVPIHGQVSFRGEAITHGTVTFFPASGRPVSAVLSGTGEYACQLPPGKYRVTITLGVDLPEGWQEGDPAPPPQFELPLRYANRRQSSLTAVVAEDQTAPIDFLLE